MFRVLFVFFVIAVSKLKMSEYYDDIQTSLNMRFEYI